MFFVASHFFARLKRAASFLALLPLASLAAPGASDVQADTNSASRRVLLTDSVGTAVAMPTNELHRSLHPPARLDWSRQIPTAPKGVPLSEEVRARIAASKSGQEGLEWLPATPPVLRPYLGNLDEFGNTALQPGALFPTDPFSRMAQSGKYALSDAGLRYSLWQSLTLLSLSGANSGANALQYYTATAEGKWAVFELPSGGPAGWLSTELNVQWGLSPDSRSQQPQANLGTLVNPNASISSLNGLWASELAWQQSWRDGELVLVAGMVDQSNYIDANNYANNSQGQFLNSAFVNSQVLPFAFNNLGWNLQYQPDDRWYVLFGAGANNQAAGQSPFQDVSFDNWSYLLEFGLTPKDVLGLGPGTYRLQPFVATVDGRTQAGVGLNVGQRLGKSSPFAYFGRFGVSGSQVALGGARAQLATGFAMQGPWQWAGLFPRLSNDYLGAGFVWSRPSAATGPVQSNNEYGFEATYVLQLTRTASIQPDLQMLWHPVGNTSARRCVVCQLQLNLTW